MATPFSEIYSLFLSNTDSYSLFKVLDEDVGAFENECLNWLTQAIVANPTKYSKMNDYDVTLKTFNIELDDIDKVILAKSMVIEYLNPFIISEVNLRQTLNSKDYRSYSPSKHIDTLHKIKEDMQNDINSLVTKHSYTVENIREKFGKKK